MCVNLIKSWKFDLRVKGLAEQLKIRLEECTRVKDRKEIWFTEEKFDFRNKDLKLTIKETNRTRKSREAHTVFLSLEQDSSFPHLPKLTHLQFLPFPNSLCGKYGYFCRGFVRKSTVQFSFITYCSLMEYRRRWKLRCIMYKQIYQSYIQRRIHCFCKKILLD